MALNSANGVCVVLNVAIVVLTVASWLQMMLSRGTGSLTSRGLKSLRYFTVLSNLYSAAVSLGYVLACPDSSSAIPDWLLAFKLSAASAVMLTFLTVVFFLAPRLGWRSMYEGGNFWLHLVLPLMAALDCCLIVPVGRLPFVATLCGAVPTVLYGVWYVGRVLLRGREKDGETYDFYGFFSAGVQTAPLVCLVMVLVSWGSAVVLRLISSMLVG